MLTPIIFYMFAAWLLASAAMVVTVRNPVYAVLFLILCFFNGAGLFLMMGAEFVAFILLMVYVGAVAVLFLFVVMMLDIDFTDFKRGFSKYLPIGGFVAVVLAVQLAMIAAAWKTDPKAIGPALPSEGAIENTRALGHVLYTEYFYPFQVLGFILLVAMVGAIVLTLRTRKDARHQDPRRQLSRTIAETVEIVSIKPGEGANL